jgi:hypothetical protein
MTQKAPPGGPSTLMRFRRSQPKGQGGAAFGEFCANFLSPRRAFCLRSRSNKSREESYSSDIEAGGG